MPIFRLKGQMTFLIPHIMNIVKVHPRQFLTLQQLCHHRFSERTSLSTVPNLAHISNCKSFHSTSVRFLNSSRFQKKIPSSTRPVVKSSQHKVNVKKIMEDQDEWITLGNQRIHAWSISGVETCIVAKIDNANLTFDLGYATRPSVKCSDVFISHGHIDHVAGMVKHAAHRSLYSMKPATYHVPPHLVNPLKKMAESMGELHGGDESFSIMDIKGVECGESIGLRGGFRVVAFPTNHRVPSQGYLVYRTSKQLKKEYLNLSSLDVGKLIKEGHTVHDLVTVPELAYTGDTTFDVFKSAPIDDLLKVKTLITEATYIDDEKDKQGRGGVERAQMRGHIHIQELVDNEELFCHIDNIVLIHFSDKYSTRYIRKKTDELLPDSLRKKVSLGVVMKEKMG